MLFILASKHDQLLFFLLIVPLKSVRPPTFTIDVQIVIAVFE